MTFWNVYWWGTAFAFVPLSYIVYPHMEQARDRILQKLDHENEAFSERLSRKMGLKMTDDKRRSMAIRRRRIGNVGITLGTPILTFVIALAWPLILAYCILRLR